MNRTIDYARKGGTVLLFGVPPAGKNLELEGFRIFRNGLTILSSFTSVRNSFQAVDLLKSGYVRVDSLISHRLPLSEMPRALELIESRDPAVKKVIVHPNG
jgi:threonine dehydrogenase-like Zn-dependent dehydrogenase